MQVKVSDFIFDHLHKCYDVDKIFMISGGGAMHLNDSVGKNKNIQYLCNHHEQASSIGAEAFARISGKTAVVVVTTGPGGSNTLTGLIGQWLDSVPVIYISGQVKYETCISSCSSLALRQLGDQEINIVDIVKPVTKYAVMVVDPNMVKYELDKAMDMANSGRKGPVWLDIPLNVQGSIIETDRLKEYKREEITLFDKKKVQLQIQELVSYLKKAQRPVILAGNGIRSAKACSAFEELLSILSVPVVSSFLACDLLSTNHPLYAGRVGTIGNRPGNFAVQNSDLLLCIGTRNNIRQISYNYKAFAREARKVVVDIDEKELKKPTLKIELPICSDALYFIEELMGQLKKEQMPSFQKWVNWNRERLEKYSAYMPEYALETGKGVHPYHLVKELSALATEKDIIVTGNATPSIVYFQLAEVKKGQRILWNSGCASMGYDLPAALGAAFAVKDYSDSFGRNIICLAGDGSLQMNIQELQTLKTHGYPVKLFIFDNKGYISIIQTQTNFFDGRLTACNENSGVGFPDFAKVAEAYGLDTVVIENHIHLKEQLRKVLERKGPVVCHVKLQSDYKFLPKTASVQKADGSMFSRPLEDMFPFLNREEFEKNMIIKPLKED
ncbi:MAG: thiamine pyrophosphate-binding protein [Bacteroidales bacterium]